MTKPFIYCALLALVACTPAARAADAIPQHAQKYFRQYCIRCHGAKVQKADFRLDDLSAIDAGTAPQWKKVLERLSLGEMPPPDETQPSLSETDPVTTWISEGLTHVERRPLLSEPRRQGADRVKPLRTPSVDRATRTKSHTPPAHCRG